MQTCEEMSSFWLEECRHVQISFNELGKDDSGLGSGAYFLSINIQELIREVDFFSSSAEEILTPNSHFLGETSRL